MNYKIILISIGALIGDLLLGTVYQNFPPFLLIIAVFYFAKKIEIYEAITVALILGFLLELAQLSGSIFSIVFLALEAIGIRLLTKKLIDLNNNISQVLFLLVILLTKVLLLWLINDRSFTSNFLIYNIICSLIAATIISFVLIIKNAKRTKIL
jgi:hypothetical protein